MKSLRLLVVSVVGTIAIAAHAQSSDAGSPVQAFINGVEAQILAPIVTLLALGAFVLFVWGIVEFIRGANNVEARQKGQQHILWGLVGLVIIFGANAIIRIIAATVGA